MEKRAVWQICDMKPGDIIIFNIKLVHGASENVSSEFRLSLDTRVVGSPLVFNPRADTSDPISKKRKKY
jgi:ectoine hydroxylase-related dioxygenase (phytanoyl-CoA dioxygenase family)